MSSPNQNDQASPSERPLRSRAPYDYETDDDFGRDSDDEEVRAPGPRRAANYSANVQTGRAVLLQFQQGQGALSGLAAMINPIVNSRSRIPADASRQHVIDPITGRLLNTASVMSQPGGPSGSVANGETDLELFEEGDAEKVVDAFDEAADLDERERLRRLKVKALSSSLHAAPGSRAYVSPYTALEATAVQENDKDRARRYGGAKQADLQLDGFIRELIAATSNEQLHEVQEAYELVTFMMGQHPGRRPGVGSGRSYLTIVDKTAITSLCPCVFLATTSRVNATTGQRMVIPHLMGILVYMYNSEGYCRSAFTSALSRSKTGRLLYGDICPPGQKLAKEVKHPGLYLINPQANLVLIGMTYSLGLKRRTAQYESSEARSGKVGASRSCATGGYPGRPLALLWHEAALPMAPDAIIASGAVYAAESIMIAVTKAWETTEPTIRHALNSPLPLRHPSLLGLPILGLNTNLADRAGSFLHQPAVSIAGAEILIRKLLDLQVRMIPLQTWRSGSRDAANTAVADSYRVLFSGIFVSSCAMSTLYRHVQLKSAVVQRAWLSVDPSQTLTGFYLPGKNRVQRIVEF